MMNRGAGMLVLMLAGALFATASLAKQPGAACLKNARASLTAMIGGDFSAAATHFSPMTAKALPPAKLKAVWARVQGMAGKYVSHGAARSQKFHGQPVVVMPVKFTMVPLDFVVSCDGSNRIVLFDLLKPSAVEAPPPIKAHTEADGVRVEPLAVPSKFGSLRGALTLPAGKGPFPAAVLVAGSGPNDLDETVGGSKPFRDIANGLARLGVASLRYDKRTHDYPAKVAANPDLTVDEEETDDALTAAHLLAKQKQVDPHRVFVLGHSEGAMLVPRIVKRDPALAGGIMLAAPARPLLVVMEEQTREQGARQGLPKAKIKASEHALAKEQALLDKANPEHPPSGSFGRAPQSWWLSLHDYHQVAVAKSLSRPMLILQGGSDFQVSPTKDFDAWKKALAGKPDVTFHLYPGLSHLFRLAGKAGTLADYIQPGRTDPDVIQDIATWIKAQPGRN